MRRIHIRTSAKADITEGWSVDVPDDLVVDAETAISLIEDPEKFGAEIRTVTNENTSNEHARLVFEIEEIQAV